LLVDYDGKLYPIDIKATSTVLPQHASALSKWAGLAEIGKLSAIIFADIPAPVTVTPGVRAVPWWWV
jgi:hypothetical protein